MIDKLSLTGFSIIRIAMVHFQGEEHYEIFATAIGESQQLHQKLCLFRTALSSALVSLTLNVPQLPNMHEMGSAAEKSRAMSEGVIDRLKEEATTVGNVCEWVGKINNEIQQMVEVVHIG